MALTPTPIVPVAAATFDPGIQMVHDHGSVEILLNGIVVGAGATGPGAALGFTTRGIMPMPHRYTWQVLIGGGGTLSALTVNLEGSLDGTNWAQLDQNTSVTGGMQHVVNKPVRYLRANLVTGTVNTGAPTVTVLLGE